MFLLLTLFAVITPSFAQTDLDHYIQRFRYKALEVPAKRKALYDLGFKLFYDKILSGKNNISCQSCHSLGGFSGDSLPLGLGEGADGIGDKRVQNDGLVLARHTQSIYNAGMPGYNRLFWDGRVSKTFDGHWQTPEPKLNGANPEMKEVASTFESALAVQAIFPLTSPEEMLGKDSKLTRIEAWDLVMKKIFEGPFKATYQKMFTEAFPGATTFNIAHVGNAMAELIRHHFAGPNTLWDQYLKGNKEILSERMKKGAVLFHTKANCVFCHNGNLFTNFSFENIGVPQIGANDKGKGQYMFRVAPLRNVGVTAPYMHSGAFKTLFEVVDHYSDPVSSLRNFNWNSKHPNYRDPLNLDTDSVHNDNRERTLSRMLARNLDLSPEEKKDLVCFLAVALTDVSLQKDLLSKGVVNEISDCSPRLR